MNSTGRSGYSASAGEAKAPMAINADAASILDNLNMDIPPWRGM
ncbi:MAG: hypothetical protein R3D29_15190 [Nitratireductor sp.]